MQHESWYQGTADAVRRNIPYFTDGDADLVLILSGDQLYRMDYQHLLATHRKSEAAVTIAVMPVREDQTSQLGLLRADETGRVTGFFEKPQTTDQREPMRMNEDWMKSRGIDSKGRPFLASMGIYLFQRDALIHLLNAPPLATDFGKEIFPRSIHDHRVVAHLFDLPYDGPGVDGLKSFSLDHDAFDCRPCRPHRNRVLSEKSLPALNLRGLLVLHRSRARVLDLPA